MGLPAGIKTTMFDNFISYFMTTLGEFSIECVCVYLYMHPRAFISYVE